MLFVCILSLIFQTCFRRHLLFYIFVTFGSLVFVSVSGQLKFIISNDSLKMAIIIIISIEIMISAYMIMAIVVVVVVMDEIFFFYFSDSFLRFETNKHKIDSKRMIITMFECDWMDINLSNKQIKEIDFINMTWCVIGHLILIFEKKRFNSHRSSSYTTSAWMIIMVIIIPLMMGLATILRCMCVCDTLCVCLCVYCE